MSDSNEVQKVSIWSKVWNALSEKGKFATITGIGLSSPANIWALYQLYNGMLVTVEQLYVVILMNVIGIAWTILPSSITIKSGKGLEIEIKD